MNIKTATQNYRNARRFLGECNSVAILRQYRGTALNQCRNARNALLDEMLRVEQSRVKYADNAKYFGEHI